MGIFGSLFPDMGNAATGTSFGDNLNASLMSPLGQIGLTLMANHGTNATDQGTLDGVGAMYRRSAAVSGASSLDGDGSGTEKREPVRIDVTRAASRSTPVAP